MTLNVRAVACDIVIKLNLSVFKTSLNPKLPIIQIAKDCEKGHFSDDYCAAGNFYMFWYILLSLNSVFWGADGSK